MEEKSISRKSKWLNANATPRFGLKKMNGRGGPNILCKRCNGFRAFASRINIVRKWGRVDKTDKGWQTIRFLSILGGGVKKVVHLVDYLISPSHSTFFFLWSAVRRNLRRRKFSQISDFLRLSVPVFLLPRKIENSCLRFAFLRNISRSAKFLKIFSQNFFQVSQYLRNFLKITSFSTQFLRRHFEFSWNFLKIS